MHVVLSVSKVYFRPYILSLPCHTCLKSATSLRKLTSPLTGAEGVDTESPESSWGLEASDVCDENKLIYVR